MYFIQIKTYFGQSTYSRKLSGQLVDEFLPNSNLYLDKLVLNEWHIYGSSRLGIYKANVLVASKEVRINTTSPNGQTNTTSDYNTLLTDAPILAFDTYSQTRGAKNYELSNHLGNVLVVITDKKYNCINIEVYSADFKTGTGGFTAGWSDVNSGWSGVNSNNASTVSNNNGRLKTTATLIYGGNRQVINTQIGKAYTFTFKLDLATTPSLYVNARATNGSSIYTGTNLSQLFINSSGEHTLTFTATTNTTQLLFEKASGTGATYFYIDDALVYETDITTYNYFVADVVTANDYSPFGAPLAGRSYTAPNSDYRFAFNGKERDNETYGDGNAYDFGARIYDPRLGRWLSLDVLQSKYPSHSAYSFSINSPIRYQDIDGNVVVDGAGNIAVYINNEGKREFTKYATEDIKTAINLMTKTGVGTKVAEQMITSCNNIKIVIDKETSGIFDKKEGKFVEEANENTVNRYGTTTTNTRPTDGTMPDVTITVYAKSFERDANSKTPGLVNTFGETGVEVTEFTAEDLMGATFVHEGIHATDPIYNSHTTPDKTKIEDLPKQKQLEHFRELDKNENKDRILDKGEYEEN